jgi:hypothetical protein
MFGRLVLGRLASYSLVSDRLVFGGLVLMLGRLVPGRLMLGGLVPW